jgi:hypothetical protein
MAQDVQDRPESRRHDSWSDPTGIHGQDEQERGGAGNSGRGGTKGGVWRGHGQAGSCPGGMQTDGSAGPPVDDHTGDLCGGRWRSAGPDQIYLNLAPGRALYCGGGLLRRAAGVQALLLDLQHSGVREGGDLRVSEGGMAAAVSEAGEAEAETDGGDPEAAGGGEAGEAGTWR